MYKVILVIHVMTTIALIAIVLAQRTSSDGMGLSGSSSNNGFLSGRAAANFASRSTALLALIFILTSLTLGVITTRNHVTDGSIADKIKAMPAKSAVPVPNAVTEPTPAAPAPANAAVPVTPAVAPVVAPAAPPVSPAAPHPAVPTPSVPKPE